MHGPLWISCMNGLIVNTRGSGLNLYDGQRMLKQDQASLVWWRVKVKSATLLLVRFSIQVEGMGEVHFILC